MSESSSGSTPSPSTDEMVNTFREAREYARGELDVEHSDIHPIAGLIDDDDVREMLVFMAETYDRGFLAEQIDDLDDVDMTRAEIVDEMPRSFWQTDFARETIRKYATEVSTRAIAEGNFTQTAFLAGLPSYKSDVSGLHAIHQLREWLVHSEQCKLIYLAALMGRGKTDLACTFYEVVHDHYARLRDAAREQDGMDESNVPVPEFAANFDVSTPDHVDAEVREIRSEREMLEWAEGGDSSQVRWFIFDEASTALTAQSGANAQKVAENMAPFVKRMRKLGINMIVIGHDKGDVHVAIRSLADFVDKTGLKTASFYSGITNREPSGHLFDVAGIPPTSWDFDTDDMAEWEWIADEDGEGGDEPDGWTDDELKHEIEERGARLWDAIDELNQSDVAQNLSNDEISISASGVSRGAKRLGITE